MTREEAIKTLKENYCAMCAYGSQDMDSCDIRSCDNKDAIKALEQPCEDAVSREFMYKLGATCIAARNENGVLVAIASIESLPPVTPQPKTGRWREPEDKPIGDGYCSLCGHHPKIYPITFKYCPNCGAKMESEDKK